MGYQAIFLVGFFNIFDSNGGNWPAEFTPEQQAYYTNALEGFRAYYDEINPDANYHKPIDYDNIFSDCVKELLDASDCN